MSSRRLICGLEIHAELKTHSKMFCSCTNDPFDAPEPNCYTCPVCLGMPGGLPVSNKKAIELTIAVGLALNCSINLFSKFDRKHYFYPDLPKGYQISQYDLPFCYDGYLETSEGRIEIERIHLEEDTGKLLHKTIAGEELSLVDFNRSGVPLLEIVTKPDIKTASQAKEFGRSLRTILRHLDAADCNMQEGGMRLEANISLQDKKATELPRYKVEVKNINSFRFMEHAIEYESKRQGKLLDDGKTPAQETRGWNPDTGKTFAQRSKEDAKDYRYFPDPDIPPIRLDPTRVDQIRAELPELPRAVAARWVSDHGLDPVFAERLAAEKRSITQFNALITELTKANLSFTPAQAASALVNQKFSQEWYQLTPDTLLGELSNLLTVESLDVSELDAAAAEIVSLHSTEVSRYQTGETQLFDFLMGQLMRAVSADKPDPAQVRQALERALHNEVQKS